MKCCRLHESRRHFRKSGYYGWISRGQKISPYLQTYL